MDARETPRPRNDPPVVLVGDRLRDKCELTLTRRSGPGGQHRNKVASAVVLKHLASGLRAEASERRSQAENRQVALGRLRVEFALGLRDDVTEHAKPLVTRYSQGTLRVARNNDDYPVVLADILNRILRNDGHLDEAVDFWNTSGSQILRLLRAEPLRNGSGQHDPGTTRFERAQVNRHPS